jgi:hypothetical protein
MCECVRQLSNGCERKLRSGCERQLINFYVCEEAEQKA